MTGLPEGWAVAKGEQLFELIRGVTYNKTEVVANAQPGFVGVLRATNIQKGEADRSDLVYAPAHCVSEKQLLKELDLLLATSSGSRSVVGKLAEIGKGFDGYSFGAFCSVARPFTPEFSKWVSYFSKSRAYRDYVEAVALGTNINNFRSRDIDRLEIPLPPLSEQRRIVRKLDALSVRNTTARAHLTAIEKLVERYKLAVLTRSLFCVAAPVKPLGDVLTDIRYGTAAKCTYDPTGIPVLRIPNIQSGSVDRTDLKTAHFTPKEIEQLSLKAGDLLVIRSNGSPDLVGRVALVTERETDCLFAGYLIRLRLSESEALPEYIRFCFQSDEVRAIIEAASKSTSGVNNVNSTQLKGIELPLPPIDKQREIVHRIETAFAKIDRLASEAEKALKLTDRLDQRLLAKAFAGELVPQDPNDEPAAVLLERIHAERGAKPKVRRGRRTSTVV